MRYYMSAYVLNLIYGIIKVIESPWNNYDLSIMYIGNPTMIDMLHVLLRIPTPQKSVECHYVIRIY